MVYIVVSAHIYIYTFILLYYVVWIQHELVVIRIARNISNPSLQSPTVETQQLQGADGPTERSSGWLCLRRPGSGAGAGWSGHAGPNGVRPAEVFVRPF